MLHNSNDEWTRIDGMHRELWGRGRPIEPPTGAMDEHGYVPIVGIYCRTSQGTVQNLAGAFDSTDGVGNEE